MFPARITLDADHEPFALAVDAPMADVMDADTTDDPCISAVDVPAEGVAAKPAHRRRAKSPLLGREVREAG